MRLGLCHCAFIALALLTSVSATNSEEQALMSSYVTLQKPWLNMIANSDQRQPIYLGLTPRQMEIEGMTSAPLLLPEESRIVGEQNILQLAFDLQMADSTFQLEMWPVASDWGLIAWSVPRYRTSSSGQWMWLSNATDATPNDPPQELFLPQMYNASIPLDFNLVFQDFLQFNDLYLKPVFGDCVWMNILMAWLNVSDITYYEDAVNASGRHNICLVIPQPPRWNGVPTSFVTTYLEGKVTWDSRIQWVTDNINPPFNHTFYPRGSYHTPAGLFAEERVPWEGTWLNTIVSLDGEQDARFPISNLSVNFTRKNPSQPNNQLLELVQYLTERYTELGVKTVPIPFTWRGIAQSDLLAIIPSPSRPADCACTLPVVLADHFDTAFCEDIFAKTGQRVSNPGADDNLSAVTTLLTAAALLVNDSTPRCSDIWLLHLTGEEFPADSMGCRYFASLMLQTKQDLRGVIQLDMISHTQRPHDPIFQLSPGPDSLSYSMALLASSLASALPASKRLQPIIHTVDDPMSFLWQTDGMCWQSAGFPVLLFNEHFNEWEYFNRRGYHDSHDLSPLLNVEYGTGVASAVIATLHAISL